MVNAAFSSHHIQIHQHSVGRAINSTQSCEDGIVAITAAALPHWTSIEIFWIRNWQAILSSVCSMTEEPICHTTKCTLEPHAPKVSTQRGDRWKFGAMVEYFLALDASGEFAILLAPLKDVDKLDGARVSEQVKSQTSSKRLLHGIKVMPSGLLPLSWHTSTGSRTVGTPPDTKARQIVSLTAACWGIRRPLHLLYMTNHLFQTLTFAPKYKYVQQQRWHPDANQGLSLETHYLT